MSENTNPKVKTVHMAVGLDLLGSKTSFVAGRNYDIESTPIGIKIHSFSSGRTIVVPYPNVKGFELLNDGAPATEGRMSAASRAQAAMAEAHALLGKQAKAEADAAEAAANPVPQLSEEEARQAAVEARAAARKAARESAQAQVAAQKSKA